jgi:hypothetical protein
VPLGTELHRGNATAHHERHPYSNKQETTRLMIFSFAFPNSNANLQRKEGNYAFCYQGLMENIPEIV